MNSKFIKIHSCNLIGQWLIFLVCAYSATFARHSQASDLSAVGQFSTLAVEVPGSLSMVKLVGPDSCWQLVVTAKRGEELVDVTTQVDYQCETSDVVNVDKHGLVTPVGEGKTVVRIQLGQLEASLAFEVSHIQTPGKLDFIADVAPLFSRYACNTGGCHGKKGGQDGFELALLGFEPELDYERLVHEGGGYRLNLKQPAESMLLVNATDAEGHTGGKRFEPQSAPYRLLERWIAQGAPRTGDNRAEVERIEVLPAERVLAQRGQQQLLVVAHCDDGTLRDVSRLVHYESNQAAIVDASPDGLVRAGTNFGVAAVMVRYQTHVSVFRALVPSGLKSPQTPPADNFVDQLVGQQLRLLGIPSSPSCDDGSFIRRATIDIAGRLPTSSETNSFIADVSVDKVERLVDRLLATPHHASFFAGKWAALWHNRRNSERDPPQATAAFYNWLRQSIAENTSYRDMVSQVLLANGEEVVSPPVVWYRTASEPSQQLEDVAQLLLGQRVQCARCHHHPLERWSEADYHGLGAFFSRVEITRPKPEKKQKTTLPITVAFKPGKAQVEHPKTKRPIAPTPLGAQPLTLADDIDPRQPLVEWLTSPDNAYFSRTLVNRYWKHFLGLGLVEPEDDLRATNPASNPQLLDALAEHFTRSGFDLRQLIRVICTSSTYRRSSTATGINVVDDQNYSRFLPRRLPAEVFADAIDDLTLSSSQYNGVAEATRAIEFPDNQHGAYVLDVFGRPEGLSVCECERSDAPSVAQLLYLLNSPELMAKVQGRRAQVLAADSRAHQERIDELYLAALSRSATVDEQAVVQRHIQGSLSEPAAYADVLWALLNTKEFLFNR
jgi:hypothetical protein